MGTDASCASAGIIDVVYSGPAPGSIPTMDPLVWWETTRVPPPPPPSTFEGGGGGGGGVRLGGGGVGGNGVGIEWERVKCGVGR